MKPSTIGFILGLALLCATLWALDATAGSITMSFGAPQTLTTTGGQDAKLAKFLAKDNAERVTQGLPTRTLEQYLLDVLTAAVTSYLKGADERDAVDACAKYKTLSGAEKTTITTLLLANPCP